MMWSVAQAAAHTVVLMSHLRFRHELPSSFLLVAFFLLVEFATWFAFCFDTFVFPTWSLNFDGLQVFLHVMMLRVCHFLEFF